MDDKGESAQEVLNPDLASPWLLTVTLIVPGVNGALQMKWRAPLLLSIPIGMAAFLVLTARAVVVVVDGPDETLYGFPLFWIKSGPTSLSFAIDVPAAAADLAAYVLMASLIAILVIRIGPPWLGGWAVRATAWVVAAAVVSVCALALSIDPFRGGVTFNPAFHWANIRSYSIYLGVPGKALDPAPRSN